MASTCTSTPSASISAMRPAPMSSRRGMNGPAIGPERMLGTPSTRRESSETISGIMKLSSTE